MYLLDGKMKQGEGKVVQSRQELLALFSQDEIDKYPDLKGIDFSTQTLLIGCDGLPSLAHLNYAFYKNKDDDFIFFVEIGVMQHNPIPIFITGLLKNWLKQQKLYSMLSKFKPFLAVKMKMITILILGFLFTLFFVSGCEKRPQYDHL